MVVNRFFFAGREASGHSLLPLSSGSPHPTIPLYTPATMLKVASPEETLLHLMNGKHHPANAGPRAQGTLMVDFRRQTCA